MIQLVDQVRIKLVSQWIKDISRTEVRLNQAKYYPNSLLRLICHENMQQINIIMILVSAIVKNVQTL